MITECQEEILSAISKGYLSPTNIAKSISCSLPYVVTQLKILEAQSIISKKKFKKEKQIGRPQHNYSISRAFTQITNIHNADVSHTIIQDEVFTKFIQSSTQIHPNLRNVYSEYFWTRSDAFKKCITIGKISTSKDEIELLAITTTEHVQELRKIISDIHITQDKHKIHIACWVHTIKECENGIKENDSYYLNLLKKVIPLVDNDSVLKKLQQSRT